jgi:nucleotide-binding universal stress UspA family protein
MYKTIVVHVDSDPQLPLRTGLAARLAQAFEAHLVGSAATGLSRDEFFATEGTVLLPPVAEEFTALVARTRAVLAPFAEQMRRERIASWEERVVEASARTALVLQSRYADLLVVGQVPHAFDRARELNSLPGYLSLHCSRPVLVVPAGQTSDRIGETALVGWDGSMEACRAVAGALPLLRRARRVWIAMVNSKIAPSAHGEEPGADLALYLARHGATVEVVRHQGDSEAGEILLDLARSKNADFIVAGAYGHSRFREWFIGGATHTLLHRATVPLLIAH